MTGREGETETAREREGRRESRKGGGGGVTDTREGERRKRDRIGFARSLKVFESLGKMG